MWMAELVIEGDELVVRLRAVEKVEAVHGEVRVPAAAVRSVEVLEKALAAVHGLRAPGMAVPGMAAVGTFYRKGVKTFAVVHHDMPRGVRVSLEGADYDQLIVGCEDPEAVAAALGSTR
jgi:hypothetical protein